MTQNQSYLLCGSCTSHKQVFWSGLQLLYPTTVLSWALKGFLFLPNESYLSFFYQGVAAAYLNTTVNNTHTALDPFRRLHKYERGICAPNTDFQRHNMWPRLWSWEPHRRFHPPPTFTHSNTQTTWKEAVLSAAPWLINQMDSGSDEGVGAVEMGRLPSHAATSIFDLFLSHHCRFIHTWLTLRYM